MVLREEAIGPAMNTSLAASNAIVYKDAKLQIQKFHWFRSFTSRNDYFASPSVASSLFPPSPLSLANKPESGISRFLIHGDDVFRKRKVYHPLFYLSSSSCIAFAVERDSSQFEIDPEKAREALQDLDQQLESLSEKQRRTPKIKLERDSSQFEIDPEKAREALQDLDQQLESLSEKQRRTPKIKPSGMKFGRTQMREEMPEISETFLVYSALALFIFSIFYNVLFYTIIKPAIDGQQLAPPPPVEEIPKAVVLQQLFFPSYLRDFLSMAKP